MGAEGMWGFGRETWQKVERAERAGFPRPWETKTSLNDKGPLGTEDGW